ncbi:MAG: hypothetical protein LBR44_10130 [Clostridiales Family XIII bacterium]|nr:hypothetical protein [Clostridiales Family XIII bacterium]
MCTALVLALVVTLTGCCGTFPFADMWPAVALKQVAQKAAARELGDHSDLGVALLVSTPGELDDAVEGWDILDIPGADGGPAARASFAPAEHWYGDRAQRAVMMVASAEDGEIFGLAIGGGSAGIDEAMSARGYEEEPSAVPFFRQFRKGSVRIAFLLDTQAGTIWRFYFFSSDSADEEDYATVEEINQGCSFDVPLFQHSSHGWPTRMSAFTAYNREHYIEVFSSEDARALTDGSGAVYGVCYYFRDNPTPGKDGYVASHVVLESGGHVFGVGTGDPLADARAAMAAYGYEDGEAETVFMSQKHALYAQSELEAAGYSAAIFHKDGINIAFLALPGEDRIAKILVWATMPWALV